MLRTPQEEQIKYFHLDRKLGSGNLNEIGEALDEIALCLGRMRKLDLVNSLVMRMLDLMHTVRSFHVKQRLADIFRQHAALLASTHSRDEIAAVLARCLKGSDQYTRMIAMEMVAALSGLFLKDIAVYHTLLAKLSLSNIASKEEQKGAVLCLAKLLSASPHLSRLFSKNVVEIQEQYNIPLHVIIYLLTFLVIGTHLQKQILETVLSLITTTTPALSSSSQTHPKPRSAKKQLYYFQKLVLNYAASNYRIVELYQLKLRNTLPCIEPMINKIKSKQYPFMKNTQQIFKDPSRMTIDQLIDQLYQRKKEGVRLDQYQTLILQTLNEFIRKPIQSNTLLLLPYFLQDGIGHIDKQISLILINNIETNHSLCTKRSLKQTLTVGLFECSKILLDKFQLFQANYIFLKLYIEFKLADTPQALQAFIEIASILSDHFGRLLESWSIINKLIQKRQSNGASEHSLQPQHSPQHLYSSLQANLTHLTLPSSFPLKEQSQLLSIILHNKGSSIQQLQEKCYHLLPGSAMQGKRFWFAYLGKEAILELFSRAL